MRSPRTHRAARPVRPVVTVRRRVGTGAAAIRRERTAAAPALSLARARSRQYSAGVMVMRSIGSVLATITITTAAEVASDDRSAFVGAPPAWLPALTANNPAVLLELQALADQNELNPSSGTRPPRPGWTPRVST
jgi:hypothetical protein